MKDKNYYLDPAQWNFGACPADWLDHCYNYEYAREVKWLRDYYNYCSQRREFHSIAFSEYDLLDLPSLTAKLNLPERAFDTWLTGGLPSPIKDMLRKYKGLNSNQSRLKEYLITCLNTIISGDSIFEESRFIDIPLRPETKKLLSQKSTSGSQVFLNRKLIEDAYPQEVSKKQKTKLGYAAIGLSYFTKDGWFRCAVEDEVYEEPIVYFWLAPGFPNKPFMELEGLEQPVCRYEGMALPQVRQFFTDDETIDVEGMDAFFQKNNASLRMSDRELVTLFKDWIKTRRAHTDTRPLGEAERGRRKTDPPAKSLRALGAMRLLRETSAYRALRFTKAEVGHPLYPKSERFTEAEVFSYEVLRREFAANKEDLSEASQVRFERFF